MPKERNRKPEQAVSPELARTFAEIFIPRYDMFPVQRPDGSYVTLKRKLSLDLIISHLQGFVTLGAYALDAESQARWICLDADTTDQWQRTWDLAEALHNQGVVPYLEILAAWRASVAVSGFPAWCRSTAVRTPTAGRTRPDGCRTLSKARRTQDRAGVAGPAAFWRASQDRQAVRLRWAGWAATCSDPARTDRTPGRAPTCAWRVHRCDAVAQRRAHCGFCPVTDTCTERDGWRPPTFRSPKTGRQRVYDFVGQYVPLDERGRGHCPFHDDQHMSLGVNREGNYWHCFAGCGGGSLIDFAMKWRTAHGEDGRFTATIKALADAFLPR